MYIHVFKYKLRADKDDSTIIFHNVAIVSEHPNTHLPTEQEICLHSPCAYTTWTFCRYNVGSIQP